jgi:hypothetical protein
MPIGMLRKPLAGLPVEVSASPRRRLRGGPRGSNPQVEGYPRTVPFDPSELGFVLERQVRGVDHHVRRPNRFLTYWVQIHDDGTALFTWEFAIGEYAATLGLQVGSDEHLNTFLFPRDDARGPQDAAWLAGQIETTELLLRSFSLVEPEDATS